jgi:hypothetical protein
LPAAAVLPARSLRSAAASVSGQFAGRQFPAYAVDANGHAAATPLPIVVTDADRHFVLPRASHWPLLSQSTGGSYTEEATGVRAPVGQSVLSAVCLAEPSTMVITPYSSAVVVDAQTAGGLTASNGAADGSLIAPADDACYVTTGAENFATNPLNHSGVTALPMLGATRASDHQTASASASACGERAALVNENPWLFRDARTVCRRRSCRA